MKVNEIWGGGSLAGVGAELAKKASGEENWNATTKQSKKIWDAIKNKFVNAPVITPDADKSDTVSSMPTAAPTPTPVPTPSQPVTDISKTVPPGRQFRFQNPDFPGSYIIIRQDGYFQDKIPKNLNGQIKKVNGLYPVLRPDNIKKYNVYYDQAADAGRVKEEPVHAL